MTENGQNCSQCPKKNVETAAESLKNYCLRPNFQKIPRKSGCLEAKYKEISCGSRLQAQHFISIVYTHFILFRFVGTWNLAALTSLEVEYTSQTGFYLKKKLICEMFTIYGSFKWIMSVRLLCLMPWLFWSATGVMWREVDKQPLLQSTTTFMAINHSR